MRRPIETLRYTGREDEVLSQVRDMFEKVDLVVESNVVEEHQVLMDLPHIADVRYDREAELLRQQTDGEKFAYSAQPSAIGLDEIERSVGEKILEEDAVRDVFAGSDFHWFDLSR